MLVLLGGANLISALRGARQAAAPAPPPPQGEAGPPPRGAFLRPLAIGLVHGLAGSAAVALLVLAAIGDPRWGVFYLLIFGVGTILGMTLITLAIALPFRFAEGRLPGMERRIRLATGVVSLVLGLLVAWQVAIAGGLFGAAPTWTPE
jgi:high-affinity nickel-transport protein